MARIVATGKPKKHPDLGEVEIVIEGGPVVIYETKFNSPDVEDVFDEDMKIGPSYPLCADPNTMRRALFVLYEWFGAENLQVEGEIEPMQSLPGVIY